MKSLAHALLRLSRVLLVCVALSLLAYLMWLDTGLYISCHSIMAKSDKYPATKAKVAVYDTRKEAEAACGKDNIFQGEILCRTIWTMNKEPGYSCGSDLRNLR
jgi:hypothetical protein